MGTQTATMTSVRVGGRELLQLTHVEVHFQGPEGAGQSAALGIAPLIVGSGPDCDITLEDPRVSRVHCEIRLTQDGILLKDLGSKNGTFLGEVRVREAILPLGSEFRLGKCQARLSLGGATREVILSDSSELGAAFGMSLTMRALFAQAKSAAVSDLPILIEGESGTGKELIAQALHDHSPRAKEPYCVLDCSVVQGELLADELFGHEAGAFTSADTARQGLFARAHGGTLFLDEIGEMPLELQAHLLRTLQEKRFHPIGGKQAQEADVRIIAATHRNLRARMQEGAFRKDLFFRLAGFELRVPPLRDRRDDIPGLVERFLAQVRPARTLADLPAHALALLSAHSWPGNVRELRNVVQRLAFFPELPVFDTQAPHSAQAPQNFHDAREEVLSTFERGYLRAALDRNDGNISATARELGVSRQCIHRLIARYDLHARGLSD